MKIAILLGYLSLAARPLDFFHIYDSERGLSGTDLAFIRVAEELQKLGHEIHLYTVQTTNLGQHDILHYRGPGASAGEEIFVHPIERLLTLSDKFDAAISFNEPMLLPAFPQKETVKILYHMLNDFSFVNQNFDQYVDKFIGVSDQHTEYLKKTTKTNPEKWRTIPLGCDPDLYKDNRIPGRVFWCSSADRGLHWLLSKWEWIKRSIPEASLHVAYHWSYSDEFINTISGHPHTVEVANRLRYIKTAMKELKELDVRHIGSVSRDQMIKEWNAAAVFGFSCDTVAFSEGFSVSTLEAHASYTVPVITDCDCLGSIYKDSGAVILDHNLNVEMNLANYTKAIIAALGGNFGNYIGEEYEERIRQCRKFAQERTWKETARRLEQACRNF
jgi:glycosyltransferase involved in cell wall biosynthesis